MVMHTPFFRAAAAGFTEQGVVADGTQKLAYGSTAGSDTAHSFFFASFIPPVNDRGTLLHYGNVNSGGMYRASWNLDATRVDPAASHLYDDAAPIVTGINNKQTGGERLHMLVSTQPSGSNIRCNLATWTATDGWDTGSATVKTDGSAVEFSTRGDELILLRKRNDANIFTGTLYRMAWWVGSSLDAHLTSTQNLFVSGASLVDPADSVASLGDTDRVFDAYGDKDVWDSGIFPKGTFTKTGNAFVDV